MARRSTLKVVFAFVLAACCSGLLVTAQQVQDVGTWRPSAPIADSRSGAGVAVLSDGRTLITGGRHDADGTVTDSIVVYDPTTNEREEVGHLRAPRVGHTATLLKDGRVLIIGGSVANVPTTEIEMVDLSMAPDATGSTFAFLNQARTRQAATRLQDGRVLIVGGNVAVSGSTPPSYTATDTAEMYDPESGQVTILPERLTVARAGLSATTTIDGRVLIAGGTNDTGDLKSAEMFDPARGFELLTTELSVARSGHTAILLPHNNTVLMAGGTSAGEPVTATDAFLPAQFPDPYSYGAGAFAAAASMPAARTRAIGGPSGDSGFAYVAGGDTADSAIYRYPTVKTDKNDYAPGEPALITGSGWQPNSEVTLTFQEDPAVHDDYVLNVPTDALGNFSWNQWAPEQHDFDVRFYLLVTDSSSRAQITFTDGNAQSVTGTVVSSAAGNPPISSATITCISGCNAAASTTSSATGAYAFDGGNKLPFSGNGPVTLQLTASRVGFLSQTLSLPNVSNGDTRVLNFTLTPSCTAASVTTQPTSQSVTFGASSVSFIANASGSPAPTVQWQVSDNAGGSWSNIGGATTSTLTVNNPAVAQSGNQYRAVFTNTCGGTQTATSNAATLTVNAAATTTTVSNATATFSSNSQSVPLAAAVTSAAGTVNQGTVTFTVKDGVVTIGSPATSATMTSGAATATYTLPAGAGAKAYTIHAVYNPAATGANFAASTDAAHTLTVGKADQTITFGALGGKTFGDADFTVAASASSSLAVSFVATGNCTVTSALVHLSGAGPCTVTASQAGDSNYNAATPVAQTFAIGKAGSTTTVTVTSAMYDGTPHGATAAVTGVGGLNESAAVSYVGRNGTTYPSSSTAPTDAGDYTASASFAGDANHQASTDSKDYSIAKANQAITFAPLTDKTFGDADFTVAATATSTLAVSFAANGACTLTGASVHITGAGSCTITASQVGNGNYNAATDVPQAFSIGKATATITVTPYDVTFDANAHTATGTASGVGGEDLSSLLNLSATSHTNAGTYTGDAWTFAGDDNYAASSGTVNDKIKKADATVTVNGYTGVFDGAAHGATGSATGVGGADLEGLDLGASFTNVPGGTAHWVFTDATGNYNDKNGDVAITISKADATITVSGYTGVFDGAAHGATGSATGVGGAPLAGLSLGSSFTNVPGGTAHWVFTDATGNYNDKSGDVAITISKADATITVSGYTGVFDGAAHGATGSATGVGGATLAGLNLGASFTNVPGGTAHWVFTDATGNYNDKSGDVAITISKADAIITVSGYTGVFDGAAHGATGSATGVGGATLTGLTLGSSFTNVPGGTAHWVFTDATGNYNNDAGYVAITITKADAIITVNGYTGVFDGAAHGATGSATGVGGAGLAGLDLGASFTNVPGGTAHWVFTDATGNYNNDAGDVAITITKADAIITVNGYTGVFDAAAHGATGSATGVGGATLAGLNLGASFTNVPGGTAHWVFTDATGNYNNDAGDVAISITKADAIITVNGYTGVFDAAAHGATGSATGVGGAPLAGLSLGSSFTNVPGGTAHWVFTDATGNYNNDAGDVAIAITKADAIITVNGYTGVFDAAAHGPTGSATGVGGAPLAGLSLGSSFTNVPGGTAHWVFTDATGNYNNAGGDSAIVITKAKATIVVTPYSVTYDGDSHTAAGTATGVKGENLSILLDLTGTTHTAAGTYSPDTWTFAGNGNYEADGSTVSDTIAKAKATIVVTPYSVTYDGNAHTATGTATGAKGESLSALLDLTGTTHTGAGTYATDAWTFAGNGNYEADGSTVSDTIAKANASIVVNGYTGVYDGTAHGATGSATGVGSGSLVGLNLGASFTGVPGGTAHWTFTDATGNYNNKSGDVAIVITKATLTVKADAKTKLYDGSPFSAFSATVTGFVNYETQQVVTGAPGFSTAPVSPAVKPGTYTIKPAQGTLAAANYSFAVENGTLNINYGTCSSTSGPGNVILPPINSDGTSVYNRKGGSTIPVKFRVCDAAGKPISDPSLVFTTSTSTLTMVSAVRGTVNATNEDGITDIPDVAFRWTGQEWIFNMATSNLTAGSTYKFQVNLLAGAPVTFQLGVK